MGCFDRFHLDSEGETVDQNETDTTQMFPTDFQFESPTAAALYNESVPQTDDFDAETARLLAADDITECATEFVFPIPASTNTLCFGPAIQYENYPVSGENGILPAGDLGIWLETEPGTDEACAARVLNEKLADINAQIHFTRQSLASMVCVLRNDNTTNLPTDGSTLDMTDVLGATVNSDTVEVLSATIAMTTEDNFPEFTYALILGLQKDADAQMQELRVDLRHHLLNGSGSDYEGAQRFQLNQLDDNGNCLGTNTVASSVQFQKVENDFEFHLENSDFCKKNDNPFILVSGLDDLTLDPTYTYDGLHIGGWANRYNILIGNTNRDTKTTAFTFFWQAGPQDGYSRILNVNIGKNLMTDDIEGTAYYGYGLDLTEIDYTLGDTADPAIAGFICDWATPGNQRIVQPVVQSQSMHFEPTLDLFVSDGVNIGYAPTHNCSYNPADEDDGTFFSYDIDGNQIFDASDDANVNNMGLGVTNDLLPIGDMDFTPPTDLLSPQ